MYPKKTKTKKQQQHIVCARPCVCVCVCVCVVEAVPMHVDAYLESAWEKRLSVVTPGIEGNAVGNGEMHRHRDTEAQRHT